MAIPGQANINIANTPNDPLGSDSLYTAFNTIQNNFTTLFSASSPITSISAGPGIGISNATSASYQIVNTGVTSLIAGNNITITSATGTPSSNGSLIISATGGNGTGGGVTSVGLVSNTLAITNTPIISTGNIDINLANVPGVTAGAYTNPNMIVDGYGRVTSISNGVSLGVTSVAVSANGVGLSVSGSPITGASGNNTGAGTIQITNTGVTSLIAGTGIVLSGNTGAVTISSTGGGGGGTGTVTSVGISSNTLTITGSPVVSAGTINVDIPSNLTLDTLQANSIGVPNINTNTLTSVRIDNPAIIATTYGNTANTLGILMRRGRGTGTPLQVLNGDTIGGIRSQAYTNFNIFQSSGSFAVIANGSASNSSSLVPSDIVLNATTASEQVSFKMQNTGNMVVPGAITTTVFSNSAPISTQVASRSRGNASSVSNIISGDYLYRLLSFGQTGNGTSTVNDISGYSYGGGLEVVAAGIPSSSGAYIPSNVIIRSISSSNNQNIFNFTATGNLEITGVFSGNGAGLSALVGANVAGQVSNSAVAGTVYTNAQPNITSVGTLVDLSVTGNVTAGGVKTDNYYYANGVAISFAGTYSNSNVASYLPTYTGNIQAGNLNVTGTITGNGSGLTSIPAANLSGDVNNNISVTATANTTAAVGNIVSITINGTTYQLLAV